MNHLESLNQLKNRYFTLRHGESKANQQNIIVSSPDNGIKDFGLSDAGKMQVQDSVLTNDTISNSSKIISSDFLRAYESAEIAKKRLDSKQDIQINENLRERYFGDYELQDISFYQAVWEADQKDSSHTINKVESADAVMERTTTLIVHLEKNFKSETFLLVSHGDALQILQAAFDKIPASLHRSLPHLENAEIRELILKNK